MIQVNIFACQSWEELQSFSDPPPHGGQALDACRSSFVGSADITRLLYRSWLACRPARTSQRAGEKGNIGEE